MIVYRCAACEDGRGSACYLLVADGELLPDTCPYDGDVEADWDWISVERLFVGVQE